MKIQAKTGNETLMQREKTAFVCSRKTPDGLEYLVGKWLLGLSDGRDCIMCGNQSPMERAVFTMLLQRKIPTILVLAEAMPSRWGDDVREALAAGRLLVITHCDASVHSVTARSAFDRNVLMLSLAQKIVVGCCTKGGKLERALAGFDNVEYLANGQPWLDHMELINGQPKEEKRERRRLEREEQDMRNRAYDLILRANPEYRQTERVFWIVIGVGFVLAIISLVAAYAFGDQPDMSTWQGVVSVVSLVVAYVLIIGGFVYDLAKRRPIRKKVEAQMRGMNDKKLLEVFEQDRKDQLKKKAEKDEKRKK